MDYFAFIFAFNPLTPRRTHVSPLTEIVILFFKKGSSKIIPMKVATMSRYTIRAYLRLSPEKKFDP